MPSEVKSKGVKITIVVSKSLRDKFRKHVAKDNCSQQQRLRDLIQKDLKGR